LGAPESLATESREARRDGKPISVQATIEVSFPLL
jgi:hypothetical protein